MVTSEASLLGSDFIMRKIGIAFIMVVILATVVALSAAIGAAAGMLIAFLLAADMSSAAPIGALAGGFASLMFLLNAKENGRKGLGM